MTPAMYISGAWIVIHLTFLLSVTKGNWEVLNDNKETDMDELNFQEENFIPAEVNVKVNRESYKRLASPEQNGKQNKHSGTELKTHNLQQHSQPPTATIKLKVDLNRKLQKNTTSQGLLGKRGAALNKSLQNARTMKNDDDVNITKEGFLLIENRNKEQTQQGSKLHQFTKLSSQDTSHHQNNKQMDVLSVQISSSKITNVMDISNVKLLGLTQDTSQQYQLSQEKTGVRNLSLVSNPDIEKGSSHKLACINEDSWECLMFKEDLISIRKNLNLSSYMSGKKRTKRQTNSNNESTRNIGNSQQIIGCENNDCFSGNGTVPDSNEEVVAPEFTFSSATKVPTNLTVANLSNNRKDIAKELEDQLKEIFKDVPGFKNVSVDPSKISVVDGVLTVPWEVSLDGGNSVFNGMSGQDVRDAIEDSLLQASYFYKNNVTLYGQHPMDDFNATEAADQVENEARDPCKIIPSPCRKGFGSCIRLPDNGDGIQLKCIDNCKTYNACQNNGVCEKDEIGAAYCQCTKSWSGKTCEDKKETFNAGEIAGIVIGSLLIVAGALGCIIWFICIRRSKRDRSDTDEEGPELFPYTIDRPSVSLSPLPIFRQATMTSPVFSSGSRHGLDYVNINRQSPRTKIRNSQESPKILNIPYRYYNTPFDI